MITRQQAKDFGWLITALAMGLRIQHRSDEYDTWKDTETIDCSESIEHYQIVGRNREDKTRNNPTPHIAVIKSP